MRSCVIQSRGGLKGAFIYEFGRRPDDWMMDDLISALQTLRPELEHVYLKGFLKRYRPGGTGVLRLINLLYVYLRVLVHLVIFRPDFVVVRTTPPGIQLLAAWLGGLLRIPVFCWLMDYHPEIEARSADKKGWSAVARALRRVDRHCLERLRAIIVLDHAMADLVAQRVPRVPTLVHPTWNTDEADSWKPILHRAGGGVRLVLVYGGNLGASHDTSTLERLLSLVGEQRPVELHVVGCSESARQRFRQMGDSAGVAIRFRARVPFEQLRDVFENVEADLGVVLLSDDAAGLVSPSKFASYLKFGVPVLYVGPSRTNAHFVCEHFKGGIPLSNGASDVQLTDSVDAMVAKGKLAEMQRDLEAAARYFGSRNGKTLAAELEPFLPKRQSSLETSV
jgi:hypothetical protein